MARKPYMQPIVPLVVLILLVASGSGCASRGKTKTVEPNVTTISPSRLPATSSVASDSSRLSGVQANPVSAVAASQNASSGSTIDELYSTSPSRNTDRSDSSSSSACSTGSCGSCRR